MNFPTSVGLGATTFNCDVSTYLHCAVVTITFTADTSTVTPFSVPGANGFEHFVGSGTVSVAADGRTLPADFRST